ncbi:hypothetical protein COO92_12565 [Thalassospira lohafexi]|uniref:Glycosyl transferase n=2 Tax=Thalassospira lohafexi TaxID=744227 RepID=A0A2N3L6Q7_9PROT|nr:hypothetical protein COO92_12565 [Thalassospira lohafexi]
MQQPVPARHWRDTMLSLAAILFGISAPLFFFGRAALGVGLGLSLLLAIVSADHGAAWRKMRNDFMGPLGLLIVATLIVFLISAIGSVVPSKSIETWVARFSMLSGIWYLMRLIQLKARIAWDSCILATWALIIFCVFSIVVHPELLSLKALREPNFNFDITRRLKPVGSFLIFGAMMLVADAFDRKGVRKYVSVIAAIAILPILEVSQGRANVAAILAAGCAMGICLVFLIKSRFIKVAVFAGIAVAIVGVLLWLGEVTGNMSDLRGFVPYLPTWLVDVHRQMIWQFTYSHVFDHPLIGYGINASPWVPGANELAGSSTQSVLPGHPHSWFMEIWLEVGIIGLLVMVPMVACCAVTAFVDVLRNGGKVSALPLAMLAAYWFAGLFNYSFWTSWWFGVFMLGISLAFLRREWLLLGKPALGGRQTLLRRKTMIVCAEDWSFVSHRIGLGRAALVRGDDVVVACNVGDAADALRSEGFRVVDVPIARGGLSPLKSLKTVKSLACLIRREQPDVIVNVAIQCVVLSAFAGLLVGAKRSVNMITGLGFLFVSGGVNARVVRHIVSLVLRVYARCPSINVIVQNRDDHALMSDLGFRESRLALIRGSGVDISAFAPRTTSSDGPKTAIFVARMLWSKGLAELIEAARILKSRNRTYRFLLVGDADPANPDSASESDLVKWQQDGLIEWLGKRSDIAHLLRSADLAVLPSWREGLPKSLLEAASSGLAMVSTDVPGCREIVSHQENGLLVPLRDANALADAIEKLMEDDATRHAYGAAARGLVERELCDQVIIAKTLAFVTGTAPVDHVHAVRFGPQKT